MMKFSRAMILTAMLSALLVIGCDIAELGVGDADSQDGAITQDGTVTVSLSNATSAPDDSRLAVFAYERGADPDDQANLKAVAHEVITDGMVNNLVLKEPDGREPSDDDWVASGGVSYDMYIYTTTDDEYHDYVLDSESPSKITDPHPVAISIDGDHSLSFDYENDLIAPTLTVKVTGIPERDEDPFKYLYIFLYEEGVEPDEDNAIAGNDIDDPDEFVGEAEAIMVTDAEKTESWLGRPGETYQVIILLLAAETHGPTADGSRHRFFEYTHTGVLLEIEFVDEGEGAWGDPENLQF
ncbi:MAG: hypothetical protein EA383_05290 [Spirochaetaceae bacterium]|nr:MAG: hypothetical protein EA383_05290 [Spirochaetaceae bacterium]